MSLNLIKGLPPRVHDECVVVPTCREDLFSLTQLMFENRDLCSILDGDGAYVIESSQAKEIMKRATRIGRLICFGAQCSIVAREASSL